MKKSHEFDRSTHPTDTPELHRVGESPELRDHPEDRLRDFSQPIGEPQPSRVIVDLSSAPVDRQTAQTAAQVCRRVGVPPTRKPVTDRTAGPRPKWLA